MQRSAVQSSVRLLPVEQLRAGLNGAGAEHGMRPQRRAILRTTDKPPHITIDKLDPVGELRPGSNAASDSD
jgi:hypothetical protein